MACLAALAGCRDAAAERDAGWDLRLPAQLELTAGTVAPLPITLAVDRGLTIAKDAAVIVDLAPEPGVTIKKLRLGRADAVDPEADAPRFAVQVRGDRPGDHALRVRLRFWVCSARICRPVDVERATTVRVAEPAPPADAGAAPDARPAPTSR